MTARTRISHYELIEPIGRGETTHAYRARDIRLARDVALTLLDIDDQASPGALERFRLEAHIASRVTHPRICVVHDYGEDRGRAFVVNELLEGHALDETLAAGALPLHRVIDIGMQLADALAAAHRHGVVHGNLKPSNVFITTDGHVKLLELGLAAPGATSGTPASPVQAISTPSDGHRFRGYFSPERVAGAPADPRSDIFSAGALLYQMATGTPLFSGTTPDDVTTKIRACAQCPPRTINPALPADLDAVIRRAIQKDPGNRYPDAGTLLADLRKVRRAADTAPHLASRWWRRPQFRAALIGVAAALVLLLSASAAYWWWPPARAPVAERRTILLSQIANGTGDPDFDGTMRQAAAVYLAQSPSLELASDERIRSTLRQMGRDPAAPMPHPVAGEVCQRLGLQAMVEGSVWAAGPATAIALAATDCRSGATIAKQQVEVGRKEDVLQALGKITASIRESLGESRTSLATRNVPIEEATTPSLEALKAYTEATALRASGAELAAVKLLERAVAIDGHFALAYTTLSSIYGSLGETARSEDYSRRAYENRQRVTERERLFIIYQYHDRITGDQFETRGALEVWKRTYPHDYRPANALAVLLNRIGDYEGAIREAEEAARRNPAHAFPRSNLAYAQRGAGRFTDARATAERALADKLETVPMRRLLYQLGELLGEPALARRQLEWAGTRRRAFEFTGARAQVAAFRGRMNEARRLYRETTTAATEEGFSQIASGYASQGVLAEVLYGYRGAALAQARAVVRGERAYEPRLRAATALALAGQPDEVDALAAHLRDIRPDDTLLQNTYLPVAEAAALLARNRPEAAIERLRRASPYERGMVAALLPIYLRGEARLRSGAAAEAVQEFTALLANRGADPFSPVVALAHLGLARAHARLGAVDESRQAYAALLGTWAAADGDVPVLRAAREEVKKLR